MTHTCLFIKSCWYTLFALKQSVRLRTITIQGRHSRRNFHACHMHGSLEKNRTWYQIFVQKISLAVDSYCFDKTILRELEKTRRKEKLLHSINL